MISPEDKRWLDAAVRYAAPHSGTTGESPAAAALIVDPVAQTLVARAVSGRGGRPHAEALAIEAAGFHAAGCTLYVTMEPCHRWGRTPPCTGAIIRSGIMRVVIGAADPSGEKGSAHLEATGVKTTIADHQSSLAHHAGLLLQQSEKRPAVTAMLSISADGKIDRSGEHGASLLSDRSQGWISMLRARSDAILVGAASARTNPALTVDLPGLGQRTPLRVVLSGATGVDRSLNLIGSFSGHRTAVIAETSVAVDAPVSVQVIRVTGTDGRPNLRATMAALANRGVQNVVAEPGPGLLAALLKAGLVDAVALIHMAGSIGESGVPASMDQLLAERLVAAGLTEVDRQQLGGDMLVRYGRASQPV